MSHQSLVSVIIIFFNAERFLRDAIESILAQTYEHWELFLVDDGSTDTSTQIALQYAEQYPESIIYLEHPGHVNRGKGISRNLGIFESHGDYVAFLDADDIWLPKKLEEQVAILHSYPGAGMLYGNTLYWHSWTGHPEDIARDHIPALGVKTDTLIHPPALLPLYLRGRAAVPCTCSIIVRRSVAEEVGGFDESCKGINNFYEDQAFYAKICLAYPVVAVDICWDQYRQRSSTEIEDIKIVSQREFQARASFLHWLDDYLTTCRIEANEIRSAIRKELWLQNSPTWLPDTERIRSRVRWVKKWILLLEEKILPESIQHQLWLRKF